MRDLAKHIENTVKDAVSQECRANGIDPSEAGWAVGGGGMIGPMIVKGQLAGFGPTWTVTFSLRSWLLGYDPVAGCLPVYDVLPSDGDIQAVVKRLVSDVSAAREKQFKEGAN